MTLVYLSPWVYFKDILTYLTGSSFRERLLGQHTKEVLEWAVVSY
jgi:hypothetical protein